ncbi:MAG: MFS transporter, partial [Chloroflexota bacterium]|nr:MFS transporter [Chloroflexota bacterium]
MSRSQSTDVPGHDSYAAFRFRDYRFLISGSFLMVMAQAILSITVGYELYERTGSALALGMVGLAQIVPNVLFSIPAGQFVDQHDAKVVSVCAVSLNAASAAALAMLTRTQGPIVLIYVCLFLIGVGRAFRSPTQSPLLASVIPSHSFSNAVAWNSSSNQTATILGPAIGGFGIALFGNAWIVFAIAAGMLAVSAFSVSRITKRPARQTKEKMTKESLLAGIRFITSTKVLFAAITLDMVAVLLGGATALLPIFAEDVLDVGAVGLGLMRSAPAVGAVITSLAIARKGPFEAAGRTLLLAVTGFGLATILFGVSRYLPLSLFALMLLGVFDSISVVIRNTLQ